jgi:hypothetical protein
MSAPAEKSFPAPVMTITRTSAEAAALRTISASSRHERAVSAFFFSGRSMTRCATLSASDNLRLAVCASDGDGINQFPLNAR